MKTCQKFADAVNKAIAFIDIFGDNLQEKKLTDCVSVTAKGNKIVVSNSFGTSKEFDFNQLANIYDEINAGLSAFTTGYTGYISLHDGYHGDKSIGNFQSKLALNGTLNYRVREATVYLKGRKVWLKLEITEIFTEEF